MNISNLILAFYAESEGNTDERFLPKIIERTTQNILLNYGKTGVDVTPLRIVHLNNQPDKRSERILEAAKQTQGFHALIIHADADDSTSEKALRERITPGLQLIESTKMEGTIKICEHLISIIPVRMVESWMIADYEILRSVIGTTLDRATLGIPNSVKNVERIIDPKYLLNDVISLAFSKRRQRRPLPNIGEYYEPLSLQIRIEILRELPSFQEFEESLTSKLFELNLLDQKSQIRK